MNTKTIVTALLLLFVAGSIGAMIWKESGRPVQPAAAVTAETLAAPAPVSEEAAEAATPERQVIAYYFHGTARCVTCRTIEAYTQQALSEGFPEDLQTGSLVWKVVNVDEPENEHFVRDYQLSVKSVVLSELENGKEVRWKKLEEVWNLVGEQESFLAYIQSETSKSLSGSHE